MRPCRDRLLDQLMKINEYRTSLFPLSYPSGKPGGRVNWGQCRAPKNSATVKKSHLQGGLLLRQRRRLLLLQLELGADRWEVARPYSAWGKFFDMKFKDRVTTRGSLTRSPTLAMVGGRCLVVSIMEEMVELFSSEGISSEVGWRRLPVQPSGGILWGCQGQSQQRAEPKSCDRAPSEGNCLARSDYGCSLGSRVASNTSFFSL